MNRFLYAGLLIIAGVSNFQSLAQHVFFDSRTLNHFVRISGFVKAEENDIKLFEGVSIFLTNDKSPLAMKTATVLYCGVELQFLHLAHTDPKVFVFEELYVRVRRSDASVAVLLYSKNDLEKPFGELGVCSVIYPDLTIVSVKQTIKEFSIQNLYLVTSLWDEKTNSVLNSLGELSGLDCDDTLQLNCSADVSDLFATANVQDEFPLLPFSFIDEVVDCCVTVRDRGEAIIARNGFLLSVKSLDSCGFSYVVLCVGQFETFLNLEVVELKQVNGHFVSSRLHDDLNERIKGW